MSDRPPPPVDKQLEALGALHELGTLSDDELAAAKARLLGTAAPATDHRTPPRWRRPKAPWLALAGLLLVVIVGAGAWLIAGRHVGSSHVGPITGTLDVPRFSLAGITTSSVDASAGGCAVADGYDDVRVGSDVTARNASGKIVATTQLTTVVVLEEAKCEFGFQIPKFNASKIITLEVGHRGQLTYNVADLRAKSWYVSMSLG